MAPEQKRPLQRYRIRTIVNQVLPWSRERFELARRIRYFVEA